MQQSLQNVWAAREIQNEPVKKPVKGHVFKRLSIKGAFSKIFSGGHLSKKSFSRPSVQLPKESKVSPRLLLKRTESATAERVEAASKRVFAFYDELTEVLARSKLSLSEKKSRIATYLGALQVILEASVCHGDLKPENILWDENCFVISDFNGAIVIDDVCELMNEKFRFENEEEKNGIKRIVYSLCDKNAKGLAGISREHIQKLISWKVLTPAAFTACSKEAIDDKNALVELREYLATKFLPDCSKGYASMHYYQKMSDAFWQCDKEKFKRACQAFDLRAAGLTVYAILTGTYPPESETDKAYYDTLEDSLKNIGVSQKVVSIIRKMAEPSDLDCVSIEELKAVENEFCGAKKQPADELKDDKEKQNQLEASLRRLTLNGLDDKTQVAKMKHALIEMVAQQFIDPEVGIPIKTCRKLINKAFDEYPDACEVQTKIGDELYTTVLLLNPEDLDDFDVVIKQKAIGDGATLVAYKAFSLRFQKQVVIKYPQEDVSPREAQNAEAILSKIGVHEGVQEQVKRYRLQRMEDYKQVVIEPFYKLRDFAPCILGDLFCSKCSIVKKPQVIRAKLGEMDQKIRGVFATKQQQENELNEFRNEYGKMFAGIVGTEKTKQLFEDYKVIIDRM